MRKAHKIRYEEPLALLGLAALSLASSGAVTFYFLVLVIGAALAVRALLKIVRHPENITMFHLLANSILLGYFLGPLISIAHWYFGSQFYSNVWLAGPFAYAGYSPVFSLAAAAAYLSLACLAVGDRYARPICASLPPENSRPRKPDKVFLLLMVAVVIYGVGSGQIGYMGTTVSSHNTVTVLGSLAALVLPALVAVLAYLLWDRETNRRWRILYLVLLLLMLVITTIQGRRVLIFTILTTLCFLALKSKRWREGLVFRQLLRLPRRLALLIAVCALVLIGMFYFFALRTAFGQHGPGTKLMLNATTALTIMQNNPRGFLREASAQSEARSGTLPGYLGRLLESPSSDHMFGGCLYGVLVTSTPRAFLRHKQQLMQQYSCSDETVNRIFGLPMEDSPTTLLTQGYADFGWLGLIIYPLMAGFILQLPARYLSFRSWPVINGVVIASLIFAGVFVEQDTSFYFVTVRNLIVIAFIAWIVTRITTRVILRTGAHIWHIPVGSEVASSRQHLGREPGRGYMFHDKSDNA